MKTAAPSRWSNGFGFMGWITLHSPMTSRRRRSWSFQRWALAVCRLLNPMFCCALSVNLRLRILRPRISAILSVARKPDHLSECYNCCDSTTGRMRIRNQVLLKRPWLFPLYTVGGAFTGLLLTNKKGLSVITLASIFIVVISVLNVWFFVTLRRQSRKPPES